MTHTLHRRGERESLAEDYVVLVMPAKGVNFEGSEEKMRQIWEVFSRHKEDLVNFGNLKDGNSHMTDMETFLKVRSRIAHAVFKDREALKRCLAELKDRDLGISVVVSGLHDEVEGDLSRGRSLSAYRAALPGDPWEDGTSPGRGDS